MALGELYGKLSELEAQRGEVLEVRARIRAELGAIRAIPTGSRDPRPNINHLAVAHAESAGTLRHLDDQLRAVRGAIVQARLAAGHKPDCPVGVISAWAPFLDSGRTKKKRGTK